MFVVFEGIDGSGKTTVSNLVVERLRARGLTVKHLRAEGRFVSSVSEAIRSLARDSRNLELEPRAEFLLYVARDVQLIDEALRPALASHDVVIADRFLHTAEVLARFGRSLPLDYVRPVIDAAAGGMAPDLVVLIDVDPTLARARRKSSKLVSKDVRPPSRKGLAGVGLQHRVRRGYLELAREQPAGWLVIDNEQQLEHTVATVTDAVEQASRRGAAAVIEEHTQRARSRAARREAWPTEPEHALEALCRWVRERAEREPHVAAYMLGGLFGDPVDGLREELASRATAVMLSGLTGLTDPLSWSLRERLVEAQPGAVARSLAGMAFVHPRAHALRAQLLERAPEELVRAAARHDDPPAWQLRDALFEVAPDAVVASLASLAGDRAWSLRERWLASRGAKLEHDYASALLAARSVHGLDDERAWALRERARGAAPIASLASIGTLTSERAWSARERALGRASKVVMETLRRLADERAFALRWQVASHTKEALDSILDLDVEEAWRLRDAFRDVWPSTVVKTLGALADGERGRALVRSQLAAHPQNVSLLKHVAAIALGVHRRESGASQLEALSA
jgi:dTMP kinase